MNEEDSLCITRKELDQKCSLQEPQHYAFPSRITQNRYLIRNKEIVGKLEGSSEPALEYSLYQMAQRSQEKF